MTAKGERHQPRNYINYMVFISYIKTRRLPLRELRIFCRFEKYIIYVRYVGEGPVTPHGPLSLASKNFSNLLHFPSECGILNKS